VQTTALLMDCLRHGALPRAETECLYLSQSHAENVDHRICQNGLAKLVSLDETCLSHIVCGVREPRQHMRQRIATVVGCDAEWLFERTMKEADKIGTNLGVGATFFTNN